MASFLILFLLAHIICATAQQPIVVDDSFEYSPQNPSGIQYFGSAWLTNNTNYNYLRYNATSHAARSRDNGFIFAFRGSSISWYADRGRYSGPITLNLDGATTSVSNYAPSIIFQQELWKSPNLDDGDHQLVVTNTGSDLIGVDSLVIIPSSGSKDIRPIGLGPGALSIPSDAILVDDTDSSVQYSGLGWQQITGSFMGGSARATGNPGDSCTFVFTGPQFWYFVNDFDQNAAVNIEVDGEKLYTGASDTRKFVQKMLWMSPPLNDGQHTVKITHAGSSGASASLEFFMYLPSGSNNVNNSSNSGGSPKPKSFSAAAIAGGIVGGAACLALLAGALFWYLRRKKTEPMQDKGALYPVYQAVPLEEATHTPSWSHSTPFDYGNNMIDSPPAYQPSFSRGGVSERTNHVVPGYTGSPEAHF
ncbi:transmembrane protein [Ceratobasidium sp. AG-Ba]|nr:transmembrane protein [Ceratobasidium sp. AG-Ba]